MSNEQMVHHLEDMYYDPDYYIRKERDDNELWLRADDDAEERWFEKLREGDL